jgi:glycosyltransferase involved in cell wall biosynthesis
MISTGTLSIAHVDAEQGFSGGEVQVFLLMEGLRARGHRNVLFAPPGSASEREARRLGLETRAVAMRNDLDLPAVLRLQRAFAEARVDLVHLHTARATWLGGLAARRAGLAALTTRRQDRRVARSWRTRLVHGRLVRRTVAISPAVARRLEQGGVARARLATIPSAVDPARLVTTKSRAVIRAELGLGERDFVVLTLAALVARKGVDVLLDACARHERAIVLLVAGDGPERAGLERRAHELGLGNGARFLGPRADKAELLEACDVFALASRAEGLGVAALEAMACSRPVVASAVGGLAEAVVHERTGLLVPPGDAGALAAALRRLHDDRELVARFGAEGPRRVREGYLAEQMVAAYESLYRAVLAEGAARPDLERGRAERLA